jgi:ABC-2 type transport system ATP-binding protein
LSDGLVTVFAMTDAIVAEAVVKTYGSVRALDGLDLRVPEGTVLGLLGPNGAGKTTCVRILTTLLRPDSGKVRVRDIDVLAQPQRVREIIGLSGQNAAIDEYLTGFENLEMIGRLYHIGAKEARQRANDLLERFDLTDAANRPAKTYSGGMRRRLDLAGALVTSPPVIFLDEPTTGLDPRSRLGMWEIIQERVDGGTTLLLTTQYLEEADRLCENIIVIDQGRSIAEGTPDELKRQVGGERIEVVVADRSALDLASGVLKEVAGEPPTVDEGTLTLSAPAANGAKTLIEAVRRLDAAAVELSDIGIHRATLDDVFMSLTGQAITEAEADAAAAGKREGKKR